MIRIVLGIVVGFLLAVHVPRLVDIYYDSGLQSNLTNFVTGIYNEYK